MAGTPKESHKSRKNAAAELRTWKRSLEWNPRQEIDDEQQKRKAEGGGRTKKQKRKPSETAKTKERRENQQWKQQDNQNDLAQKIHSNEKILQPTRRSYSSPIFRY